MIHNAGCAEICVYLGLVELVTSEREKNFPPLLSPRGTYFAGFWERRMKTFGHQLRSSKTGTLISPPGNALACRTERWG